MARILVGDDTPESRELLSELVKLYFPHVEATFVVNGREVIARAREERYDVIIMDVRMPVMDGLEATRRLRQDRATADVPIIAVTAQAMAGDREKALEAGCTDYIAKPYRLMEMVTLLRRYLSSAPEP